MGGTLVFVSALVLAVGAAACAPDDPDRPQTETSAVIANRNLDVLFMIDDSSSMRLQQDNLNRNFGMFMDVLKALPGGLPNIHVAVISQDMGAGDGSVASCDSTGGKNGIFQYTPRGTCAASPLMPNATYLSSSGGVVNFTGDISAAFSCIAALGESGCGFEHQFAAILRALGADGKPVPAENQGFLRRDALLAIVMITNEDDCSARPEIMLYDTGSNTNLNSVLGPPSNFRCNEFGHVCNGAKPPRLAPGGDVAAVVPLQNCTSSECDGSLTSVAEFVGRIKALKAAPGSEILMAAFAGPPTPYQVQWKQPSTSDTGPWPLVAHSCTAVDTSFADPGVRISQAVGAFGTNGLAFSICDTNFGPGLQQIATRIGSLLSAGGGGPAAGTVPTCATGLGGSGAGGATGAGGGNGGSASGGATGSGATTGADGSVDGRGRSMGGGCQVGGASVSAAGVAFALTALLAALRRRRARRGAALSRLA